MKKMTHRQIAAMKTRENILDEGLRLITQHGFQNLSVEDITIAAGVSKGTFYTYFKRKEDILYEICTYAFRDIERRFIDDKNSSIIKKLTVFFTDFILEVQRYGINITREWIRDVIAPGNLCGQKNSGKWFADTDMVRNILSHSVRTGQLKRNTPVDALAYIITSQMYGMMTGWCMSDGDFNPSDWVKKFCDLQLKPMLYKYIV